MANQVVGTGSVEIIFDYEKNLKNMLSSIQKEWNKVDVSKRLDEIDKSLDNLTKKTKHEEASKCSINSNSHMDVTGCHLFNRRVK